MGINSFIQFNLFLIYDYKFKFSKLLINNFISAMYLLAIPGFFAPDFYLGYIYGKEVNKYSRVISALFINRIIGFIKFFLFASIAIVIMGSSMFRMLDLNLGSVNLLYVFLFVVVGLLLFFIIKFFFRKKIIFFLNKSKQILHETKKGKGKILTAFVLKLLFNIVGISGRIAIGLLLGIDIPIYELASIIVILNFLIALPISFNGIGVREIGYIGLLTLYGVPSNIALSFALCEFGITLSVAIIGAISFTFINVRKYILPRLT